MIGMKNVRSRWQYEVCFYIITSFLLLMICTKSSYLYPLNDWVDANCYFTVGKSMANGMVLYRDICEQKGPYLYLLHMLAYLLSSDTFIGVFWFEVAACAVFIYYSSKLIRLYVCNSRFVMVVMPLAAMLVLSAKSFCHGDSAEEFCLPLLMYSLFFILNYAKNGEVQGFYLQVLVNGICCGVVLWTKYTMLGFYFGWIAVALVIHWNRSKGVGLLRSIGAFATGVFIATAPWLLYFWANDALDDMIKNYFYNNLFLYPTSGLMDISGKAYRFFYGLLGTLYLNAQYTLPAATGTLFLLRMPRDKVSLMEKIVFVVMPVATAFFIYVGGRAHPYYGLALAVFLMPAFSGLLIAAEGLLKRFPSRRSGVVITLALILALGFAYLLSDNVYLIGEKQENMPQYRFAAIINEVPNARLLNYGFLDGGFYTAANLVPCCKYFCKLNVDLPEQIIAQRAVILDGEVDFIVCKKPLELEFNTLVYEIVDEAKYLFEGKKRDYLLYRRLDAGQ